MAREVAGVLAGKTKNEGLDHNTKCSFLPLQIPTCSNTSTHQKHSKVAPLHTPLLLPLEHSSIIHHAHNLYKLFVPIPLIYTYQCPINFLLICTFSINIWENSGMPYKVMAHYYKSIDCLQLILILYTSSSGSNELCIL